MRKFVIPIVALYASISVAAYEYPNLNFVSIDGTTKSVAVDGLELTYSDGRLVVVSQGETLNLDASQLSKMYFASDQSMVGDLVVDMLGSVAVYSTLGVYLGEYSSVEDVEASLVSGIYIVKSSGRTDKIVVR